MLQLLWKQRLCQTTGILRTQGAISNKVNPVINVFTDEPEIQCDVQVAENTLVNGSK